MRKIYLASSWRNTHQPKVLDVLRNNGHEVYDFRNPKPGDFGFSWSQVDPNWKNWSVRDFNEALNHPVSQEGFLNDFEGMRWADTCVLLLPSGKSAHIEAGYMAGEGKDTFVYCPDYRTEPELMYKLTGNPVFNDLTDLIEALAYPTGIRYASVVE